MAAQVEESHARSRILEAARQEFFKKGFEGARMQTIADAAGINKALLHYYFNNKETLFNEIFESSFRKFIPHVEEMIVQEQDVFIIIRKFVHAYISLMQAQPSLPLFLFHEINKDADRVFKLIFNNAQPTMMLQLFSKIDKAQKENLIKPIRFEQLVMNIMSMCVFPFLAKPMMQRVMNFSDDSFDDMMEQRKQLVADFIIDSIQITTLNKS
jgi:AcrR family transcriptional regulator